VIRRRRVPVERVYKVTEGFRPHIVDRMKNGEVAMLINTPEGRSARLDSYSIRRTAVTMGIPHFTTMAPPRPPPRRSAPCARSRCHPLPARIPRRRVEESVRAQIAFNRSVSGPYRHSGSRCRIP